MYAHYPHTLTSSTHGSEIFPCRILRAVRLCGARDCQLQSFLAPLGGRKFPHPPTHVSGCRCNVKSFNNWSQWKPFRVQHFSVCLKSTTPAGQWQSHRYGMSAVPLVLSDHQSANEPMGSLSVEPFCICGVYLPPREDRKCQRCQC